MSITPRADDGVADAELWFDVEERRTRTLRSGGNNLEL